jgi:mannose-6-phosphate isomerase-like protein (cupin superfamily)
MVARPRFAQRFRIVMGNRHAQAAQMTLGPGEREGSPQNRHKGADQWLFVVSGTGLAIVNGRRIKLSGHSLLLIQRGDRHEIRNVGKTPLRTLNIYVPPAYTADGDELPRGRS